MTFTVTINVANFTPHDRIEVVTCGLSLPPGYWSPGTGRGLVAIDPVGDGKNYDVEWYPLGPLRSDGTYRKLRIMFPCKVDGGTHKAQRSDNIPHDYYELKQVVLQDITRGTSIPAWTQHADVDLSALACTFHYSATHRNTSPAGVRSASFTGASGSVTAQVTGTVTTDVEELDTEWSTRSGTGRWVRSWIVPVRILPEFQGGTEAEPSYYGNLVLEVPSAALTGLGANVKWWFEWGNSLVTDDSTTHATSPARDPSNCEFEQHADPTLSISGATVVHAFNDSLFHGDPSVSAGVTTISLLDYDDAEGSEFKAGTNRFSSGMLLFGSSTEYDLRETSRRAAAWTLSTADPPRTSYRDQPWMDAVATNWSDHDNYLAFGVVPQRSWGGWASDSDMWDAAAKVCYEDREDYRSRRPWRVSVHGTKPRPGVSGGQADFGNIQCLPQVMAGFPDMRGLRISAMMEPSHGYCQRLIGGEPFNPSTRLTSTGPSWMYTHCIMWPAGEPKLKAGAYQPWSDRLGKPTAPGYGFNPGTGSGWKSPVLSHWCLTYWFGWVTLSCDRLAIHRTMKDLANAVVCTAQEPHEDLWLKANETAGYYGTDFGFSVSRAHGRTRRTKAHCWTLLDPGALATEVVRASIASTAWLHDWKETGGTLPTYRATASQPKTSAWINGASGDLDADMATVINDQGYYPTTGNDGYGTWLQGIMCAGIYASIRCLEPYTESDIPGLATMRTKAETVLANVAKGLLVWGFRKNSESNNLWQAFYAVDYEWDSSERGNGLDGSGDQWLQAGINPATGTSYMKKGNPWVQRWAIAGFLLAPRYNPGDAEVAAHVHKLDDTDPLYIFPAAAIRGGSLTSSDSNYGFGKYGESWLAWGAVIPDAFTAHSGGVSVIYGSGLSLVSMDSEADGAITSIYIQGSGTSAVTMSATAAGTVSDYLHFGSGTSAISMAAEADGALWTLVVLGSGTSAISTAASATGTVVQFGSGTSPITMSSVETGGVVVRFGSGSSYVTMAASADGQGIWDGSGTSTIAMTAGADGDLVIPGSSPDYETSAKPAKGVDTRTSGIDLVKVGDRWIRVRGRWT